MKIWFDNNLGMMGKWGGASFLFGAVITAFVFGHTLPKALMTARDNFLLYAYTLNTVSTNSYQPTESEFKIDFNQTANKINDITAPINDLVKSAIKGFGLDRMVMGVSPSPIKSPSQNIDFSKFFSSSTVSSNDIMSFLKEVTITGINLIILIISIISQVLKGILGVLK